MSRKKRLPLYEKLYAHQKPAVDFCVANEAAALFLEQRVGKTYITGGVVEQMVIDDPNFYGLIVVPLTNKESSWVKLFENELPHVKLSFTLTKPEKGVPTVCLLHYEQASKIRKKLGRRKWSLAVWDESQRLKDRGSIQSRTARMIKFAKKRMILSGTPIDEAPQDLWAQFRFVAPWVFGTRWEDFKLEYLKPTGYMGYKLKFRQSKLKRFHKKIAPYSMRITKEAVGIKKPKMIRCPVDLDKRQQSLYREIDETMVAEFKGNEITSGLRITQNILLQQICGGFVKDDEGETHWVGNAKLNKLNSLIRRVELPVVIFCKYKREIRAAVKACRAAGLRTAVIRGGRKNKALRPKILKDFQLGKYDALVSQIRTGGVGVDLWRSNTIIFYSITYSYIDYEQAKSRVDAIGKEEPPKVYLIFARNTIDELIYETILSKKSVSDKVLNKLKKRRKYYG